jgi:hypothetical protein
MHTYTHTHTNYRSDPNAETTISVTFASGVPNENHVDPDAEPVRPSKHISFIDSGYYSPRFTNRRGDPVNLSVVDLASQLAQQRPRDRHFGLLSIVDFCGSC